jgi:hypothetical protein
MLTSIYLSIPPAQQAHGVGDRPLSFRAGSGFRRHCAFPHLVAFTRGEEEVRLDSVLLGVQLVIASAGSVELLVSASLDEASPLHHEDLVRTPDG